jgi:hypothetical protein
MLSIATDQYQRCQAHFFVGSWYALKANKPDALQELNQAEETLATLPSK